MEIMDNNLASSSSIDNIQDINVNSKPWVKIENLDPEKNEQFDRETVSSGNNYPTSNSIATSKFPYFSNPVLPQTEVVHNNPHHINLYTTHLANVPLQTQEIKKEFNVE